MNDYMFGTHSWPYWARDLREYVGPMMQTFANPPMAPASISYESVDQSWTQWGWSVSLQRPAAQQFSRLRDAGAGGFTLVGTGTATVVTPPFYAPGSLQTVTLSGLTGMSTSQAAADDSGRLHVTVPIGGDQLPGAIGSAALMGVPDAPPWPATTVTVRAS